MMLATCREDRQPASWVADLDDRPGVTVLKAGTGRVSGSVELVDDAIEVVSNARVLLDMAWWAW